MCTKNVCGSVDYCLLHRDLMANTNMSVITYHICLAGSELSHSDVSFLCSIHLPVNFTFLMVE